MIPTFSGLATQKIVQAISQDLDELGFVEGKDYIAGGRNSGRTTRMLKDAMLQIPWMDPGDEIFVVASSWRHAKLLCEHVATMAEGLGLEREKWGPNEHSKTIEGNNRYFLTFYDNKHIHFVSIEALPHTLLGRRLTHDPAFFFDHVCYEFGFIQDASYDLYALLNSIV